MHSFTSSIQRELISNEPFNRKTPLIRVLSFHGEKKWSMKMFFTLSFSSLFSLFSLSLLSLLSLLSEKDNNLSLQIVRQARKKKERRQPRAITQKSFFLWQLFDCQNLARQQFIGEGERGKKSSNSPSAREPHSSYPGEREKERERERKRETGLIYSRQRVVQDANRVDMGDFLLAYGMHDMMSEI